MNDGRGQGYSVIHRQRPGAGLNYERASVSAYARRKDRQLEPRLQHLVLHHLITRPERFETISGCYILAHRDAGPSRQILQLSGVEWPIKDHASFRGAGRIGERGLRRASIDIRNFKQLSLSLGTGAPVGQAAVASHNQITLRRRDGIDRQHLEDGDNLVLRDVPADCFGHFCAPDFSTRLARDDGIPTPPVWTESFGLFIEMQSARGFVLRGVIKDARLVNNVRQIFGMARGKSIMAPRLDVEQFIEGIAVGQPGGAFLIGAEEITGGVEGEG